MIQWCCCWNKPYINAISLLLNSKSGFSAIVLVRTIMNYLFESKIQNATIYCPNHRCVFIFYHIVWLYAFYVTYFTGTKVWSYVRTIIWFLTFSLVLVHIFINIHILNWSDKIYSIISLAMYQNMASKIRIPSLTQMWKSPNFRSSSFDHFPATFLWHLTNVFSSSYSYRHQHCPCVLDLQRYPKDKKNWEIDRECTYWVRKESRGWGELPNGEF